jgi:hypothetical protein
LGHPTKQKAFQEIRTTIHDPNNPQKYGKLLPEITVLPEITLLPEITPIKNHNLPNLV